MLLPVLLLPGIQGPTHHEPDTAEPFRMPIQDACHRLHKLNQLVSAVERSGREERALGQRIKDVVRVIRSVYQVFAVKTIGDGEDVSWRALRIPGP